MAPNLPSHRRFLLAGAWCALATTVLVLPARPGLIGPDYRVQPGDALVVAVLGEAEFAGARLVGTQGTIYLPLIGTLEVAGKTLAEIRAAIVTSLREVIREPYVTVALDEVNCKRRVYITGRVERLGSQMLPLGATIVDAVVAAGILEDTDLANVQLSRTDGKNIRFDLSGLRTGTAVTTATLMQWDDRVFIPRVEAFVTVVGRVQKPGSYLLPPGRKMRVLDLMNQVGGGMVEGAEFRTALLIREGQTGPDTIDLVKLLKQGDLAQNYELRANDVLVIPEADRITVAGEVLQPVTFYTPARPPCWRRSPGSAVSPRWPACARPA